MSAGVCLTKHRTPSTISPAGCLSHRATQQSSLWPSQIIHKHQLLHNCCPPAAWRSVKQLRAVHASATANTTSSAAVMTCRRCKQRFSAQDNSSMSCSYHPSLFSGGEVAKAIGFVRASDAPEDQLERVVGRKGLMRFWDCCGAEDEGAPGCLTGFHVSFDDDVNEANGW